MQLKIFLINKNKTIKASLVVRWLRIHLAMPGTLVQPLIWKHSTCQGATKLVMRHN